MRKVKIGLFFLGLIALVGLVVAGIVMADSPFKVNDSEDEKGEYVSDEIIVKFKGDNKPFRVMKVPAGKVKEEVAKHKKRADVEYAEPNYLAYAQWVPNDPYYSFQWHLDNPVYGGIQMEEAWNIQTGTSSVIVAIVDTGIAYENYGKFCQAPDLAQTNFVAGYDFVNNDSHPNDDNRHGTHVAGTVAQSTNNALGVAGVAFHTSLMPVKVLDNRGSGTYANIANGIRYAADNGAKVINLSLGGTADSVTLKDAIAYAYGKGVTIVAACGNSNVANCLYPAAYDDYVIAVGATQYDETKAPYSNYGPSLDLVAPGGNNNLDQNGDGYADGVLQQTFKNSRNLCNFSYYFFQGTSMATPHVSGLAALLIANGNATTPDQVRAALQETAEDKGTPGRDDIYGWGLIDANAALQWLLTPNTAPTANNISATTDEDLAVDIFLSVTDPEECELTFSIVNPPANGSLSAITNQVCVTGTPNTDTAWVTYTPNANYNGADSFTYKVNDGRADSDVATVFVTINPVNDPPVANAGPDQSTYVGGTVYFDGSVSYDPDGTIVSYNWDLGDGATGTGVTISHAYTATGTYTVTLIVSDDGGLTGSDTAIVTVTEAPTGQTIHVGDITFSSSVRYRNGTPYCKVTGYVPILDASNAAVSRATVYANWLGAYSASVSKSTDSEGIATFRTPSIVGCGTFTLKVDNVVKDGWTYDSTVNVETLDSITLP